MLFVPSPSAIAAVPARHAIRDEPVVRLACAAAALLLVVAAPFERPIGTMPLVPLVLTTVEVAIVAAVLFVALAWYVDRRAIVWRTPLTTPGVALAGALLASAVAAPELTGNALRFSARFMAAGLLFVITLNGLHSLAAARRLVAVFVTLAAAIGIVALLEAAEVPAVMRALTVFRPGFHVVGGQLRATATLGYPTITSMYLEIAFALGLWLLAESVERRLRLRAALLFAAATAIGAGIVATFTRAGLIGMAASLAVVSVLRLLRTRRLDAVHVALGALGVVLVALVFVSQSPARLFARLTTEGSQAWYGARYAAPERVRMVPGGQYRVPITVTNTGRVAWRSDERPPFTLSYHWLTAGSDHVVEFNGRRTLFPAPVEPGESVTVRARVIAPATPGWYEIAWDVVHEHRTWLSTEGVRSARTHARVDGPPAQVTGDAMTELPGTAVRPPRLTLWRAALRTAAAHPLLGVGPDNFRLVYGSYLGLADWDTRTHANNMYLELLAGGGLVGLAALVWLVAASGLALWRRWRASMGPRAIALASCLAVWISIAGHGLVDTFLAFTPTYVMFALAAGLAFSPALDTPPHAHADRV